MAADLVLAILHHIAVFSLLAILAAELVLVRPGLGGDALRRLARLDSAYGGIAAAVVVIGVARVIWGAKGWEYYLSNPYFWAKMAAFVAVALLSIKPTMKIASWAKAAKANAGQPVDAADVAGVRRFIHFQLGLFPLIPAFAAAMARY